MAMGVRALDAPSITVSLPSSAATYTWLVAAFTATPTGVVPANCASAMTVKVPAATSATTSFPSNTAYALCVTVLSPRPRGPGAGGVGPGSMARLVIVLPAMSTNHSAEPALKLMPTARFTTGSTATEKGCAPVPKLGQLLEAWPHG